MATNKGNWSGDQDFLFDVAVLRRRFMDCDIVGDLHGMVSSVKLLFIVCEPKLIKFKPEEEGKMIKDVESNLGSIVFIDGISGRQVQTDGTRYNKGVLMSYTEQIFRNLLIKLQKAGIYTRNISDVKEALGDFSGS